MNDDQTYRDMLARLHDDLVEQGLREREGTCALCGASDVAVFAPDGREPLCVVCMCAVAYAQGMSEGISQARNIIALRDALARMSAGDDAQQASVRVAHDDDAGAYGVGCYL